MWSRSKGVVSLGIAVGTSWFAIKKYGVVAVVEAGGKPPFPPQPYCIGTECPKTRWDEDWDKKEGVVAVQSTIIIIAHGQSDKNQTSSKKKNAAKPQKISNKGNNVQVQKLPSDSNRFFKPKKVANEGSCIDNPNSGKSAAGGNAGDDVIEGLSPLGVSQVRKVSAFLQQEFEPILGILIHGTDPPTVATAQILEKEFEKSQSFANVETSMLDPLTAPLPGQEPNEPHPGDMARLEAVFRKYFHRVENDDAYEWGAVDVIVCPPNLVGYFVSRFLQIPPDRFTSIGVANGSFTELTVLRNGRCVVQRVGDIGFMPLEEVTYE